MFTIKKSNLIDEVAVLSLENLNSNIRVTVHKASMGKRYVNASATADMTPELARVFAQMVETATMIANGTIELQ